MHQTHESSKTYDLESLGSSEAVSNSSFIASHTASAKGWK